MESFMDKHSLSTSNSKKNIVFGIKLICFIGLVIGYLFLILPQYDGTYNASINDKVRRLKEIKEPKIVLLGNSNLTFGMDSEKLEKEVGMPVVNMGLNGDIGNYFHEEMAKISVTEGDIYVLCNTDYSDDETVHDRIAAWATVEDHISLWRLLGWKSIPDMAKTFPVYLQRSLELYASGEGNYPYEGVYSRMAVNERGDISVYRQGREYEFADPIKPGGISEESVQRINELSDYLVKRGATLVIAGYPIGEGSNTADREDFISFWDELEERLNCPVISDIEDYMFDYEYFYDSEEHLNSMGAELRTEQLAEDLKKFIAK